MRKKLKSDTCWNCKYKIINDWQFNEEECPKCGVPWEKPTFKFCLHEAYLTFKNPYRKIRKIINQPKSESILCKPSETPAPDGELIVELWDENDNIYATTLSHVYKWESGKWVTNEKPKICQIDENTHATFDPTEITFTEGDLHGNSKS